MGELPEKPLMEHVYDLLETLRRILIAVIAFMIVVLFAPTPWLLPGYRPVAFYLMNLTNSYVLSFEKNLFARPLATLFGVNSERVILIAHGWFDSLNAAVLLTSLLAVAVLSPYIAYEVYRFMEPGLYPHEKRVVKRYVALGLGLFLAGLAYGYFVVMPIAFVVGVWLATLGGAATLFSIRDFYGNILLGCLATGVFFTFPIAVLTLSRIGVVSYETLSRHWRYVVFATFAVLVAATPDPTPFSAMALGAPFAALYFLSMWLVKKSERKRG